MKIDFWYSDVAPFSNMKDVIRDIDDIITFKNIDVDAIDLTKLNFLVFKWETSWAFPNTEYTHADEFMDVLKTLQNQNFYFIADYSGAAHTRTDELSLIFLNKLKSNKIDINRLFVANNNSAKVGINKFKYENFILTTIFFPKFFLSTYSQLKSYVEYTDIDRNIVPDKKFLCLNRRMYYHKYKMIQELFDQGYLNDTRITWVHNKIRPTQIKKELVEFLNIDVNDFKSIQLEDDVMYGSQLSRHDEYLYTINPNWYYKSKVNIITETNFYENEIHITEKTWKAIYLGVPFVISASKHHLKTLRDMGFKTFNSVVSEDYDEMDGNDKIKAIIKSANELANVYNSPEVLEICRFNQQKYFDMEYRKNMLKKLFLDYLYNVQEQKTTSLI